MDPALALHLARERVAIAIEQRAAEGDLRSRGCAADGGGDVEIAESAVKAGAAGGRGGGGREGGVVVVVLGMRGGAMVDGGGGGAEGSANGGVREARLLLLVMRFAGRGAVRFDWREG